MFTEQGVTVPFTLEFTAMASEVDLLLKGADSGEGTGHASFLTPDLPPDTVIKCETDGVKELPFSATAETTSPFVSPAPVADPGDDQVVPAPTGGDQQPAATKGKKKVKKKCKAKKAQKCKKKKCKSKKKKKCKSKAR